MTPTNTPTSKCCIKCWGWLANKTPEEGYCIYMFCKCHKTTPTTDSKNSSEKTRTIIVKCTLEVPVEVPDTEEYAGIETFDIEENHCPGTGLVGAAIDALIKKHDAQGTCWACAVKGECEIL